MNESTFTLEAALEENKALKEENKLLKASIDWFKKALFGKKSEKVIEEPAQQLTFELGVKEENSPVTEQEVKGHVRKTRRPKDPSKISFPEDIPVERTLIDLPEHEKICPITNKPLVKIGEDITQKIAHRPGSYYVKEIIRPKYAAPKGGQEGIYSAFMPDSILGRCKADESLLADILVKKFADHLPLYRQSEILTREKIFISRQILSQWVVKCGLALKPLFNEMTKQVLGNANVFVDEVPVDMLNPGQGKVKQCFMWVIAGEESSNPAYRIYNFRTSREHKHASELLKDYRGIVHSDKYGAYETLANQKIFTWCPCWVHIRRRFLDGAAGDKNFVDLVVRKIKYLFMFERVAWNRSEEERLRIRQEKEIPIIDELIQLVKDRLYNQSSLAGSKFKEALGYFIGLIPHLKNYTKHAYSRLDNNVAERAVRPLAIGRKNWLFLGSEEGGEAASIILSLVQTCRALGINPREYLEDVMRRLQSHSFKKLDELLPGIWKKS
jgi:transposase